MSAAAALVLAGNCPQFLTALPHLLCLGSLRCISRLKDCESKLCPLTSAERLQEFSEVEQVTKALVVKTTIKAEHFWAFYSRSRHKSSTPCWIFLPPLTGNCSDISYSTSRVLTLLYTGEKK